MTELRENERSAQRDPHGGPRDGAIGKFREGGGGELGAGRHPEVGHVRTGSRKGKGMSRKRLDGLNYL